MRAIVSTLHSARNIFALLTVAVVCVSTVHAQEAVITPTPDTPRVIPPAPRPPPAEATVPVPNPVPRPPETITTVGTPGRGRGVDMPQPRPMTLGIGPSCTLDATVYEVRMPVEQIGKIDTAALSTAAGSVADFEKALAGLGASQPVYRIGQSVRLSGDDIVIGAHVPYISNSQVTRTDQTINSVNYRQVGAIVSMMGSVNAPDAIDLEMHIQVSTMAESSAAVTSTVKAPLFRISQMSHKSRVTARQPFVVVSIDAANTDANGKAVAYIARITLGTPQSSVEAGRGN